MPSFNDNTKEEVRSRTDIAAVIGRYVTLKPSGQTLKGLCPFHKEKTPSFHVNPVQGYYHCFGCGRGGDVFKFIEEVEGVDFPQALSMLAEECGVTIERKPMIARFDTATDSTSGQTPGTAAIPKTELLRIHEIAARFFYRNIKPNPAAVMYLKSRGLLPETVRDFRLGFAPDNWTGLIDFCRTENISEEALVTCGLAIRKENGRIYDRFRNRVMFSLCDLFGKVIGFAGRGMEAGATPKYLNSPETQLYKKKHFLYGLNHSRQTIKETGTVVVVEGYMDYLTLYQAGIRNIVASSGTALTAEHAQLLSRFARSVILTFDGDSAGQEAAERGVFTLAPFNFDLSVLILPGDEDPDSLVKTQGKAAFEAFIAKAQPWSDFIIQKLCQSNDIKTAYGKTAVISYLAPLVRSLNDENARIPFLRQIADTIKVRQEIVYNRIYNKLPQHKKYSKYYLTDDLIFQKSIEGQFLRYLLLKPELIEEARNYILPETLTDDVSSDIYSLLILSYNRDHNLNNVFNYTENIEIKRIISLLQVKEDSTEHIHDEFVQKVIHLRKKYLRFRQKECRIQMQKEPDRRDELLRLMNDYLTQIKELDGGE